MHLSIFKPSATKWTSSVSHFPFILVLPVLSFSEHVFTLFYIFLNLVESVSMPPHIELTRGEKKICFRAIHKLKIVHPLGLKYACICIVFTAEELLRTFAGPCWLCSPK